MGSLQSSPRRVVTIAPGTGRGQLLTREGSVQPNLHGHPRPGLRTSPVSMLVVLPIIAAL